MHASPADGKALSLSCNLLAGARTMGTKDSIHGLPDLEDIGRSRAGEGEAYRRLVERHQQHVSAIVWRFSRDPDTHEDLVQEVFIEAYESLPTYRGDAPFANWLARIATRVGYRYWKRQKREHSLRTVPLEEWHQITDESVEQTPPEAAAELVHGLLGQLPPRDRLVLTMRYLEGHSVQRTSQLTGWSQSMVKVQTWRAIRKLRRLLEQARKETGL